MTNYERILWELKVLCDTHESVSLHQLVTEVKKSVKLNDEEIENLIRKLDIDGHLTLKNDKVIRIDHLKIKNEH